MDSALSISSEGAVVQGSKEKLREKHRRTTHKRRREKQEEKEAKKEGRTRNEAGRIQTDGRTPGKEEGTREIE